MESYIETFNKKIDIMFYKQILNIRYRELGEELINEFTDIVKEIDINKYWLYKLIFQIEYEFQYFDNSFEYLLDNSRVQLEHIFDELL